MALGFPELGGSSNESSSTSAANQSRGAQAGAGQRSSVFVNFAQGGSSLKASADASGGVPSWLWAVLIAGAAVLGWMAWKRRAA